MQYKQSLEEIETLNDSKEKQFACDEKMIENYEEQISLASKKLEKCLHEVAVLKSKLENLTSSNEELKTQLENTENEREILLCFLDKNNLEKKSFRETLDQHRAAGFKNSDNVLFKQEVKELKKSNVEIVLKNKILKDEIKELNSKITSKSTDSPVDKSAVVLKNLKSLERENNNLLKTIELLKIKNSDASRNSNLQSSLNKNKNLAPGNEKNTETYLNELEEKYNLELKK